MMSVQPAFPPPCPDPLARAGRAPESGVPAERLYLAPPALQGLMVALIRRDTRDLDLVSPQRLTHFPASPLVTLSWFHDMEVGWVEGGRSGLRWRPFGSDAVIAGSQSRPLVSWAPNTGRGYIACFTADVAQALFGLDPAAIQDRFVPAREVLGTAWLPMLKALSEAASDDEALAVLEVHLAEHWRRLRGPASPLDNLRHLGRHWVERLAWQAREWQRTHSPRQVERRIKAFSGRSLRDWQALTRTEGLLFAARDRYEAGQVLDWAELALEEGFADQAHMSRTVKRITGFAPGEFTRRFVEDESFWLYRLWV